MPNDTDGMQPAIGQPPVEITITKIAVTTSRVTVEINRYGDGWHVVGTPPDKTWSQDDALAVASHLARQLHRAAEIQVEVDVIRRDAPAFAMKGRA